MSPARLGPLFALTLVFVPGGARADLLATDLVADSGDGLVVLDTQSGLEWLRLTESQGLSVNDIIDGGAGGFAALGFRLATKRQVESMFRAGGIVEIGTGFVAANYVPATKIIELLGCTGICDGPTPASYGWVQAPDLVDSVVSGVVQTSACCPPAGQAYVLDISAVPKSTSSEGAGTFLVRGPDLNGDGYCDNIAWFPLKENALWTYAKVGGGTRTQQIAPTQVAINGADTWPMHDEAGFFQYFTSDCSGARLHRLYGTNVPVEGADPADVRLTFMPPVAQGNEPPDAAVGELFAGVGSVDVFISGIGTVCCLEYESEALVEARGPVTVPAGTFDSVRIRVSLRLFGTLYGKPFDETEVDTYWLARHYGIVKYSQAFGGQTEIYELTNIALDFDGDGANVDVDNCPTVPDADPLDTDADTVPDACDADDDNDGLADRVETIYGTAPKLADTDRDNANDGAEVAVGRNPLVNEPAVLTAIGSLLSGD